MSSNYKQSTNSYIKTTFLRLVLYMTNPLRNSFVEFVIYIHKGHTVYPTTVQYLVTNYLSQHIC